MRLRPLLSVAALGLLALPMATRAYENTELATTSGREYVSVRLDLASVTKVPAGTTTLVVGNPAIADALMPRDGSDVLVLTGKSYGVTNVLALDKDGVPLREITVKVLPRDQQTVTVLRGTSRETWACSPRCEQTLTLGDNPDFFNGSNTQIGARNTAAGGK